MHSESVRRGVVLCALGLSGLAALVYQIIWTRLLAFSFGHTTEAISTVLAIFFGGLAIGNLIAARLLPRVRHPLRVYGLLELGIALFAVLSLPALRNLDVAYAWIGADQSAISLGLIRILASVLVLAPPTIAMGATLPVAARALVQRDRTVGRWSGILYATNTAGAVLGAYLCAFWMIPGIGLTASVLTASTLNLAGAGAVLWIALRAPLASAPQPDGVPLPLNGRARPLLLFLFGVSGFVAIGYEVVWSKMLGIVMEGTIYGYGAVLSVFLLGIALGSAAIAPFVDRIRDLPRTFGLLHLSIATSVALLTPAIRYLPYVYEQLVAGTDGIDSVQLLLLVALPMVLLPTLLFGAAFPVLIRVYTAQARTVGEGIAVVTAINTAGSILGSLLLGFWWIPAFGMSLSLYLLILIQLLVGVLCVVRFHSAPAPRRLVTAGATLLVALAVAQGFGGVYVEETIVGRDLRRAGGLLAYRDALERSVAALRFRREGRTAIVTVQATERGRLLRSNGLPEAEVRFKPPYGGRAEALLGILPYLAARSPERALVVGLGGARTVAALLETDLRRIEVVELEARVVEAIPVLYEGLPNPLENPRVRLRIDDGRHELLLRRFRDQPGYDVIASQPSHPWLPGSASLFTEEYFGLALENLSVGGVFAAWFNGFRMDPRSLLSIVASFERVFPGSFVFEDESRQSFILLGSRRPIELDLARIRARIRRPRLERLLELLEVDGLEGLLSFGEGPAAAFAGLEPDAANTDDNAFVETRIPRLLAWERIDFAEIEARLPPGTPVLPPATGEFDVVRVVRSLLEPGIRVDEGFPYSAKVGRLLDAHGSKLEAVIRETLRTEAELLGPEGPVRAMARLRELGEGNPARPEPLRVMARYFYRTGKHAEAAGLFARAHARSRLPVDLFGEGQSLFFLDQEEAQRRFDKIPADARDQFPELVFYDAQAGLRRGEPRAVLREHYDRLAAFRDTDAGRALPTIEETLGGLADALGNPVVARLHRDLQYGVRVAQARPIISQLGSALDRGDLETARAALARASIVLPSSKPLAALGARLSLLEEDPQGLRAALARLRSLAPSRAVAIAAENHFRSNHQLPLLPQAPTAELFERPPIP
ncbi:MAG: fused MFS/spermidine synthase [Myxococcota bacterium]